MINDWENKKGRLKVQGARSQECKERKIKGAGRKDPRM